MVGERSGYLLLDELALSGWSIAVFPALAGDGIIVSATRGELEVRRRAERVADVACEVFLEAMRLQGEVAFAA